MTKLVSTYGEVITKDKQCDSECRWLVEGTVSFVNIVQAVGVCALFKDSLDLNFRSNEGKFFRCAQCLNQFPD